MNRKLLYAEMFLSVVLPRVQLLVVAEWEARLMIVRCGVKCMYICMFVKCLVIGPRE